MKKQKKNSNIQKNEEINQIIKLEIYHKNRLIPIKRDRDWNIDITDAAKSLDKKWQDWYKYHKKKIQYFEAQSGIKQIVRATRGRYGSTWITFELAIQVLNSWSNSFSYQLSCAYKIWVLNLRKQVSEFNLLIKNQQQRKRRYLLGEGPCIYCYTTNGLRKIGSSTGKHRRIKSHETSVANFAFDWFFFLEKAKKVEDAIKDRFSKERPANNRDHYFTSAERLKKFVYKYCDVMDYKYNEISDEELKLYADSV